ncbi:MAG: hypothetical protein Kow0019_17290 [Methanobacteriaceae archaeon]
MINIIINHYILLLIITYINCSVPYRSILNKLKNKILKSKKYIYKFIISKNSFLDILKILMDFN